MADLQRLSGRSFVLALATALGELIHTRSRLMGPTASLVPERIYRSYRSTITPWVADSLPRVSRPFWCCLGLRQVMAVCSSRCSDGCGFGRFAACAGWAASGGMAGAPDPALPMDGVRLVAEPTPHRPIGTASGLRCPPPPTALLSLVFVSPCADAPLLDPWPPAGPDSPGAG